MRKCWMILVVGLLGCNMSSPTRSAPPETPGTVATTAPCVGTLADYCQRTPEGCLTYDKSVTRHTVHCSQQGAWSVVAQECPGVYHSISWREQVLGGGTEYFNEAGQLLAAYLETDYLAYCNGTSVSHTFGVIPPCVTHPTTEHLCAR